MKSLMTTGSLIGAILGLSLLSSSAMAQERQAGFWNHSSRMPKKNSMQYPLQAQNPYIKERAHYYHRAAEKPPVGCYTTFNDYSCGSLHSEWDFLFSSCRVFFGERCLKGPPPNPIDVYRYNQRIYPHSGDHTVPNYGRIGVFGSTPDTAPPPIEEKVKRKWGGAIGRMMGEKPCRSASRHYPARHYPSSAQPCDCDQR